MKVYSIFPIVTQAVIWILARIFFPFFIKLKIVGAENVTSLGKGPLLFASNHVSEVDVVLLRGCLPFLWFGSPMFYVSRGRSYYNSGLGIRGRLLYGSWFFWLLGGRSIYSGEKDYEMSLKNIVYLIRKGYNVSIFPTGRIRRDGSTEEVRGGVAYLAHFLNCPIIPVYISGAENMTIRSFITRKHSVTIFYGKHLKREELFAGKPPQITSDHNDFKDAAKMIMDGLEKLSIKQK